MSNYKLEVENTEKLKNDINSAFTEINAELKKDDNLIASDLFDVDKKIEELKKSRKKWADGELIPEIINDGYASRVIVEPKVSFKINHIFIIVKSTIYSYPTYYTIIPYDDSSFTYSCLYIGNSNTAGQHDVKHYNYNGKTFIHYANKSAGTYAETLVKFQSSLDYNKFLICNGSVDEVSSAISKGRIEVSFFATE